MPAFVAHSLFGADVRDAASPEIKRLIRKQPAAYEWGLQGPDLLFYNIPHPLSGGSLLNRLGGRLHSEKTDELWNALLEQLHSLKGGADYEPLLAYVLGFCCHYCLDSGAHPYIFFLQEQERAKHPGKELTGIHNRIESDIDTDIYRLKTGSGIRHFHLPACLGEDRASRRPIVRLYRVLLEKLFGECVSKQALLECFFSARLELFFVMGHTAPLAAAHAVDTCLHNRIALNAHIRRPVVKNDVLNLRHAPWHNPATGEVSERSYPELEAQALCLALGFQQRIWQAAQTGAPEHFSGLPAFNMGSPDSEREIRVYAESQKTDGSLNT